MVTDYNLYSVLLEVAHKELVQMPMFIIDSFRPFLQGLNLSKSDLDMLYTNLTPNTKSVLDCLSFAENLNETESKVSTFFRRFIRDSSLELLHSLLRFCTGSDLVLEKKIIVTFNDLLGFERRPVAHTCGCVLELPRSYESYGAFKSEMQAVLWSDVWVMDIV